MAKTTWRRGIPLPDAQQEQLRALIKKWGEEGAATKVGISRVSLMRAAAGFGIRSVTAIAIGARLAETKGA